MPWQNMMVKIGRDKDMICIDSVVVNQGDFIISCPLMRGRILRSSSRPVFKL